MRGTAWPNGAYRQHQAYEDGAPHVPVETISGVLHIRDTVFGHKWVYKLNETRRGAKLVFKRRFNVRYFVGIATVLAVCLVVSVAIVFAVFGKLIFFIHVKFNNFVNEFRIKNNIFV